MVGGVVLVIFCYTVVCFVYHSCTAPFMIFGITCVIIVSRILYLRDVLGYVYDQQLCHAYHNAKLSSQVSQYATLDIIL